MQTTGCGNIAAATSGKGKLLFFFWQIKITPLVLFHHPFSLLKSARIVLFSAVGTDSWNSIPMSEVRVSKTSYISHLSRNSKIFCFVCVGFHCRVIFTCVRMQILRVNKIEAVYKCQFVNVKVVLGSTFNVP